MAYGCKVTIKVTFPDAYSCKHFSVVQILYFCILNFIFFLCRMVRVKMVASRPAKRKRSEVSKHGYNSNKGDIDSSGSLTPTHICRGSLLRAVCPLIGEVVWPIPYGALAHINTVGARGRS